MIGIFLEKTIGCIYNTLSNQVACLIGYCNENYKKDPIAACVRLLKEIILSDTAPTIARKSSSNILNQDRLSMIQHNIWVVLNPNFEGCQKLLIINAKRSDAMTINEFNESLPVLQRTATRKLKQVLSETEPLAAYADTLYQLVITMQENKSAVPKQAY